MHNCCQIHHPWFLLVPMECIVYRFNLLHLFDLHSPRFHRCRTHWRCRLVLPWLETSWCIGGGRCGLMSLKLGISIENWMGPYQRTPKQVAWAITVDTQRVLLEISWMILSCQQRDIVHSHPFVTLGHSMKQHMTVKCWVEPNKWIYSKYVADGFLHLLILVLLEIYGLWIYAKAS